MTMRNLKWLSILSPLLFLAILELARLVIFRELFVGWPGYILFSGVILIGVLFFSEAIFTVIDRTQDKLEQMNRELLALHKAGLDITSDLDLETVLQKVVDEARALVGARHGALTFVNEYGQMEAFLSPASALVPAGSAAGADTAHSAPAQNAHALQFSADLVQTNALLAVPIVAHGARLGNLHLTEKIDAAGFNQTDAQTLERFATQAALAIENARLHQQVRALAVAEERERIAREIHDSVAQVLGYVNTKAQAAEVLLRDGHDARALDQIAQLGQAARGAYADVREHILGLRMATDANRQFLPTLRAYLETWQEQSGIAVNLETDPPDEFVPGLPETGELQLLRIIQEALANVRKHAGVRAATVRLVDNGMWIAATIEDNGSGFDPEASNRSAIPRFGLATMRERAEAVGGVLEINTVLGAGTRVVTRIPKAHARTMPEHRLTHAGSIQEKI